MRSGVPVPWYHSRSAGAGGAGVSGLTTADGGDAIGDNEVVRGDGATGIQGSLATLGDTGVLILPNSGADEKFRLNPATPAFQLSSDTPIVFYDDTDISSGAADAGLKRGAAGVVEATNGGAGAGALKGGNLKLTTNTLSSEDANGNILIIPNGTGKTFFDAGAQFGLWFTDSRGYILENGVQVVEINGTAIKIRGVDGVYQFSAAADASSATAADAGISRAGAADIAFGNGSAGNASALLRFGGGRCRGLTSSAGAASTTEYPTDGDWGLHKNTTTGVTSIVRNDAGAIKSAALA